MNTRRAGYLVIAVGIVWAFVGAFIARYLGVRFGLGEQYRIEGWMAYTSYPWVGRMFVLGILISIGGVVTMLIGKAFGKEQ